MIQSTLLLLPLLALIQSATSNTNLAPREHDRIIQRLSPFPNSTFSPSLSANDSSFMASTLSSSALLNFNSQLNILAECPPCSPFNCVLPAFTCLNSAKCNSYDGQCICPPGFGGEDCSKPLCGSLADGRNRFPREGDQCECDDGWGGLNCNVCQTDKSCSALLRSGDPFEDGLDGEEDGVCYKEGFAVKEMLQMCDVTNRKIVEMLPDRAPQVTFTCDVADKTCGFQFWIGRVESFYCGLSNCSASLDIGYESNHTEYACQKMECACIPGRMLCGEDGSVDISDFLTEEITGPAKFSTRSGQGSTFEEPAMNQLINDIFGDSHITLSCSSGECLRESEIPGFVLPLPPINRKWMILSIVAVTITLISSIFLFWHFGRSEKQLDYPFSRSGRIRLRISSEDPEDSNKFIFADHIPATLSFSNLSYLLPNGRLVLDSVSGCVKPGEIMAVIGASGAGKSTFLDLLAKKSKRCTTRGEILVNGQIVAGSEYRRVVGFVDQEDTLMSTLTVYETILYSALLRLPRDMSFDDKKIRVLETMQELGIFGIRDSRIGESGERSISGGEKRRVSIACELVTSPSILFLDEPTSGLDSFNAFNVIECLAQLAKTYHRTVVFTIHQPRSNIVALFDKLILLASGKLIYSGPTQQCQKYFSDIGCSCPPGFNLADYLLDLTMTTSSHSNTAPISQHPDDPEFQSSTTPARRSSTSTTFANHDATKLTSPSFFSSSSSNSIATPLPSLSPKLKSLISSYASSTIAQSTREEITALTTNLTGAGTNLSLSSHQRAGWWTQFTILSGRSFKNLYRNPMLMLSHYLVSILVACICGFLFKGLTNDVPGFQNRMGLFFFILSLFGFGCLTSLSVFASERLLFTRERANGYYSPITYFSAKVIFDILPLRVIPPFLLGAIIYSPIGLVPTVDSFWRFILVLILFNLTASSAVLLLSVLIKDAGVANLVGSLIMLFNLLFAGLLINRDKLPWYLQWLETGSFFHAAFEGLLVNEVRYLQLVDHRYGVDIEVPAATILSMFGFQAQAFWFPDVALLIGLFIGFTCASFIALVFLVKERR